MRSGDLQKYRPRSQNVSQLEKFFQKKHDPNKSPAFITVKTKIQKSEALLDFAISLCQHRDFDETLRLFTQQAIELFAADSATVVMLNPQTRQTIKTVMRKHEQHVEEILHKIHVHVAGWALKNKSLFVSYDLQADDRFSKRLFQSIGHITVLAAPLRAEGIANGVFILVKQAIAGDNTKIDFSGMTLGESSLNLIEQFAAVVAPHLRKVQELQRYFAPPVPEASLLKKYRDLGLLGKSKPFIELPQAGRSRRISRATADSLCWIVSDGRSRLWWLAGSRRHASTSLRCQRPRLRCLLLPAFRNRQRRPKVRANAQADVVEVAAIACE